MLVFLSGPMDRVVSAHTWVDELERVFSISNPLVSGGVQFFSPQRAFMRFGTIPGEFAMRIREINEAAVRSCSAMVLHYTPGVETWGCPMELMLADQLHKPIMVWVPPTEPGSWVLKREDLPIYLQSCMDGPLCAISRDIVGVQQWIAEMGDKRPPTNSVQEGHRNFDALIREILGQ